MGLIHSMTAVVVIAMGMIAVVHTMADLETCSTVNSSAHQKEEEEEEEV